MTEIFNSNALQRFLAATLLATAPVSALQAQMTPGNLPVPASIPAPDEPNAIPLYSGEAPGSEGAKQPEQWASVMGDRIVRNVSKPTLTSFLPAPGKATGAAVIVAPGGGFRVLAVENEGYPVAKFLAENGVAAFVLKYRLQPTPKDDAEFGKAMNAMMSEVTRADAGTPPPQTPPSAAMDAAAALEMVRSRATEWGVDPARIGMLGFSAGAMLTLTTALAEKGIERPAFIGLIYGPMHAVVVPSDAPPAFMAIAADDPLVAMGGFDLVQAWRAARRPVEFHMYQAGGHGFGMRMQSGTYASWNEQFLDWMKWNGWLGRPAK